MGATDMSGKPWKACRTCGRKRGHVPGCIRHPLAATDGRKIAPRELKPSLEAARDWFNRFGHLETCISPMGRQLFRFLLEQLER